MKKIDEIGEKMLKKSNVVGYSKNLEDKISNGKKTGEKAIQIHVKRKVDVKELKDDEVVPASIEDIKTDIIEVGELVALPLRTMSQTKIALKTSKLRPIKQGISIGNIGITAGTNGHIVKKGSDLFEATNAHVAVPDVRFGLDDVFPEEILQPGKYDLPPGANISGYIVGYYIWHKQLFPENGEDSGCPIGKGWANVYNSFAKLLGAKTRLRPVVSNINHIDFAVWSPTVDWSEDFFDKQLNELSDKRYIGQGFAGSGTVSLGSKAKYIIEEGYEPYGYGWTAVAVDHIVHKSGRTSCYTTARVLSTSVVEVVNYGSFTVKFDDVFMTTKLLDPGDSGSSLWIE